MSLKTGHLLVLIKKNYNVGEDTGLNGLKVTHHFSLEMSRLKKSLQYNSTRQSLDGRSKTFSSLFMKIIKYIIELL